MQSGMKSWLFWKMVRLERGTTNLMNFRFVSAASGIIAKCFTAHGAHVTTRIFVSIFMWFQFSFSDENITANLQKKRIFANNSIFAIKIIDAQSDSTHTHTHRTSEFNFVVARHKRSRQPKFASAIMFGLFRWIHKKSITKFAFVYSRTQIRKHFRNFHSFGNCLDAKPVVLIFIKLTVQKMSKYSGVRFHGIFCCGCLQWRMYRRHSVDNAVAQSTVFMVSNWIITGKAKFDAFDARQLTLNHLHLSYKTVTFQSRNFRLMESVCIN